METDALLGVGGLRSRIQGLQHLCMCVCVRVLACKRVWTRSSEGQASESWRRTDRQHCKQHTLLFPESKSLMCGGT